MAHSPRRAHQRALPTFRRVEPVFVLGVLNNKDVEAIIEALIPVADAVVLTEPRPVVRPNLAGYTRPSAVPDFR